MRGSFVRNEDYFNTPAHASRLELVAVDDEDRAIDLWRAGELDIIPAVSPRRMADITEDTGQVIVLDTPRTLFAAFNFDKPNRIDPAMLADSTVREAWSLALDRERYAAEQLSCA